MNTTNFPGRKKLRQEQALERATARAKMTLADRVQHLDTVLGIGVGAKRERARLQAAIVAAAAKADAEAQTKAHQEQTRLAKQAAKAERGAKQ
jgi:hypothetical protein